MGSKKRFGRPGAVDFIRSQFVGILLFIIIAGCVIGGINDTARARADEEMQMVQDSVRRAVVSCYAIEGRYPDSFDYLKEHYGLSVDEEKYFVHYEVFASNLMPEITITRSAEAKGKAA